MKYLLAILFTLSLSCPLMAQQKLNYFPALDSNIQYVGRTVLSEKRDVRCWAAGAYMQIRFTGNTIKLLITDQVQYGQNHNFVEVVLDNQPAKRIRLKTEIDTLTFTLPKAKEHSVTVYKDTEAGIGYLDFCGVQCTSLLPLNKVPTRKMEFIGNSITCGAGIDLSTAPCGQGAWYDQNNAYLSYGSVTARKLNAQFHLSSVSGIGLMNSCCNMKITMPQVYNKVNMRDDALTWNFANYQPDVVTVSLGQNDGIQDSLAFCTAYITFLRQLRNYYPNAEFVCLNSPMADANLDKALKSYINFIASFIQKKGDKKVQVFFFSKQFHNGCGGHPDLKEHEQIATELTEYVKSLMHW
ncbi:SGNH/GDSL hydrolase family protein [Pinibacter soli]|uniref:GDSL-type esterase/lipase family protein n=1 Tax=Pinibacter soli TaxID=3044211 RepID=A0ABT6RAF3_9BACT|nr:SGNH/GDSL hydrolase family protein [Pinibacter soli]MDI3319554.1 GDSL-type esterase/lipase family protein [Pinibacter soli]